MIPDPAPLAGESATLEERAREIIWRIAVWQNEDGDDPSNCTWSYALEYESEMGELVPRTIDAAREVHALYADEMARLTAEVEQLTAALDAAEWSATQLAATVGWLEESDAQKDAKARVPQLEEALRRFGTHGSGCRSRIFFDGKVTDEAACDCGFGRALTEGGDRE
jgi:hypothetical protein